MGKPKKPDEIDLETLYSTLITSARKITDVTLPEDMTEFIFTDTRVNFALWNLDVDPSEIKQAKEYALDKGWLEPAEIRGKLGYKLTKEGMRKYNASIV